MSAKRLTRRQQSHIQAAREWYASLQQGVGTPLNHVPYIREELEKAGVDLSALDPTGQHSAADIEQELTSALARGEAMRIAAWKEHEEQRQAGHPTAARTWTERTSKRGKPLVAADPNQQAFDWDAAASRAASTVPTEPRRVESAKSFTTPTPPNEPRRTNHRTRVIARLPIPRPLPAAVAAGRFGHDEDNRPIRPASDEVGAITENQATKLIDMLDALNAVPGQPVATESLPEGFRAIITAYARDFGDRAAQQLQAYARRQASLDESERTDNGWRR